MEFQHVTPCATRQQSARSHWDEVYSAKKRIFREAPNALLRSVVEGHTPGRALDIGMGQGRNAVFLAHRGWNVTGFDPSREGIRQARANAEAQGVSLHAVVATYEDYDLGTSAWDLIVMTYVRRIGDADAARIYRALKPGGLFVYENNNVSERLNDMLRALLRFHILRYEDVEGTADWHPDRPSRIERVVAQKPVN